MLLSREQIGNKAVLTKLYHAMIGCLFVLLDVREIGRMTHADVIELFDKEFIGPGKIDPSVLGALRRAYDLTHECDCDHMPMPTDGEIATVKKAVELLIRAAEGAIRPGEKEGRAA
jgi:uncharacterized protein (UPF0332 family)